MNRVNWTLQFSQGILDYYIRKVLNFDNNLNSSFAGVAVVECSLGGFNTLALLYNYPRGGYQLIQNYGLRISLKIILFEPAYKIYFVCDTDCKFVFDVSQMSRHFHS